MKHTFLKRGLLVAPLALVLCAAVAWGTGELRAQVAAAPATAAQSVVRPGVRQESLSESGTPVNEVPAKREQERDENDEFRHSPAVVKLGHLIGLNADQAATAFTVFNFLIMLLGLGYLLVKTLPRTFRKRSSEIQKHLVDARTATEEATARLSSVEQRLAKLDEQIAGLRKQAEAEAAREEQRIRASIDEESKKIVASAEAEIAAATATARRGLQAYAADLAIEQAARKLVITAEADRLLVENFATQLGSGSRDGVKN